MNYTELQSEVASYLHRGDLTAKIPSFIATAEAALFRELSIPETETSVVSTTVGGYATLPSDFGSLTKLSVTYGGSARLLDYANQADVVLGDLSSPSCFSLENGKLRLYGTSDGQVYTLYYIPVILPLSNANPSNWLLVNAQDLYLYASALEAAKYARDEYEIAKLEKLIPVMLDSVRRLCERKAKPTMTPLQIKPRR